MQEVGASGHSCKFLVSRNSCYAEKKSNEMNLEYKNKRRTAIKWEFNWRLQSKLKDIQSISFYEQLPGPFTESYLVGLTPSKYDMFL